jgi:Leucine-rich repeat (LRR) protein
MRSPSTTSRYVSAASTLQDELTPEQQAQNEARKASKSSSALRESIAKAKAAKKAAATAASRDAPKPEVVNSSINTWESIDFEDPFNQLPKGSNTAVLKKRVEGARMSGTLNIAAMSLTEIPEEVLNMYEFDSENSSNWFENVDLVKFIVADNELTEIADATFPDIDPADFDPDSDERGPQFGELETLDLHGNKLLSLPMGIRRLHQLRVLNLSNNDLTMDKLAIIMEIPSLVDLKLASNKLEGTFPSEVARLRQLESLDLRNNAVTRLPNQLSELTNLKFLDVGENELTALPFEALSKLPLRTLNAPKNNMAGTLIPESVDRLEHLQFLNVANNGLEILAANDMISLPNLHSLIVNVNRIKALPCVSTWQSLSVLAAEENRLVEIPAGFVDLKNVKTVDFTGNNITRVDEKIGLIETLSTFRIANNPLRERKLLSMSSDEIIQDLRNRCEPNPQDTDDEGSVATQFTLAPETPALENGWRVKPGGILDRSYSDLTDLESDKIELIKSDDIRCVYLQHNELRFFPVPALTMLAQGLVELDLSHNPLNSADLMSVSLDLPKLQSLNLTAAGLTTLQPLLKHLQAPLLNFLDVSHNRLTGSLPHIRQTYLEVKTFLASDNQFSRVEFEAVQGLQVLDISNNDIDYLPPKIGLLGAERSPKNWGTGSALRRFEVAGNRFRVPRWQVVAKGTDAVLEFLKDHIPTQDLPEWEHEDAAARVGTF